MVLSRQLRDDQGGGRALHHAGRRREEDQDGPCRQGDRPAAEGVRKI